MTAEQIIERLRKKGFEAYIVGGAVRDMLMGLKPKDKDIATSASPEEIKEIFKDATYKAEGKSFLVSFIDGIEVATYRTDTYKGFDAHDVIIKPAKTLEEDVLRRDLTINAMAYDPFEERIIDYVNGKEDLKNRIIRFVGEAKFRIYEDPNRIIRACRFLAQIDGTFEDETFRALLFYSMYVPEHVDKERIKLEIMKAMKIKKASVFFKALWDIGVLEFIFPSLAECWNHEHGPYHVEDVFYHNMMSGDSVSTKYPLIKLASYLHDVGKPIACEINPRTNDVWFKDHESVGADQVEKELKILRFSNKDISFISNLIRLHMRISYERLSPKSVRRTLVMLNDAGIPYKSLLRLSVSDRRGNFKTNRYYGLRDVYNLYKAFKTEVERKNPVSSFSHLALNGNDIMNLTGLKPGREVGKMLTFILDKVVENPELNNKESLEKLVLEELNHCRKTNAVRLEF